MRVLGSSLAIAVLVGGALATAGEPPARQASLRALADAFVEDGDMGRARAALSDLRASPADLLAVLREPAKPTAELAGGTYTTEIEDGTGKKTELYVVAPPVETLRARTKPLGVICLLHGLGGSAKGAVPFAERFVAQGDFVCVAPTATRLADSQQTEEDGIPLLLKKRFKNWWAYDEPRSFTLEAIRKAQELYWVDPDRIVLAGVSMGGYGTWNIGLRRPDHFAALVPIAGGISRYGCTSDKDAVSLALLENGRLTPVYSAHGTKDPLVPFDPDSEACDHLKEIGGHVTFKALDVGHDPKELRKLAEGPLLGELAAFTEEQRREVSPAHVTYVSIDERLDGAWWLRIVERKQNVSRPKIRGEVDRQANRVSVRFEGVRKVRVYLDERLLDRAREVEVVVNGSVAWRGKIETSVESILESWRSRHDPSLVYASYVDVGPVWR
jgi:predicted esterase